MDASQRGHQGVLSGVLVQADITAASLAQDLLGELAAGTGGTFFHNDNGLADGLQELAARPEYVYVLGFSPDNLKFDGSYHGLKVTLKNGASVNRANLKVDARRGYWAPNHSISPAEEAKEEIEDAVFSREEMLDIPVKLHTEFFKQSEAKAELTVETRVDLKALKFRKADDRNRDTLTVVTGLFDQNGRYMKGTERTHGHAAPRPDPGSGQELGADAQAELRRSRPAAMWCEWSCGTPKAAPWPPRTRAWKSRK